MVDKHSYFKDYLAVRNDIIADNPFWWLGTAKYQLPTFEYYVKNCIEDKGGKYDFTQRNYSTYAQVLEPIENSQNTSVRMNNGKLYRFVTYSMWMGSPFNYKEEIIFK